MARNEVWVIARPLQAALVGAVCLLYFGSSLAHAQNGPPITQAIRGGKAGAVTAPNGRERTFVTAQASHKDTLRVPGSAASRTTASEPSAVASSRDGVLTAVAPCCSGLTINVHRTSDGALLRTLIGHTSRVRALAFSRTDGIELLLASADEDGLLKIWRIRDAAALQTIAVKANGLPVNSVQALAFSPDDKIIAEGDIDAIRMYDAATGDSLATLPGGVPNDGAGGNYLDFTSDGKWLVLSHPGSAVRLWSVPNGSAFAYQHGQAPITAVAHSLPARLVASSSRDGSVQVRSTATGRLVATLTGNDGPVHGVAFSPAGDRIATAGEDGAIRLWSSADFSLTRTLRGHSQPVRAIAFSPDGTLLASGSAGPEQLVKLWSVNDGARLRDLSGSDGAITSLEFAPDGASVFAGSEAGSARRWSVADGSITGMYSAPSKGAMSIAVAPHGQRIAAGWNGRILFFDTEKSFALEALDAHSIDGTKVAYAPDGLRVLAGNPDGAVRIWDTESGAIKRTLHSKTDAGDRGISCVAFSRDNDHFVYGRSDGLVVLAATDGVGVPNVVGMSHEAAMAALAAAKLIVGTETAQPSTIAPTGNVIGQSPERGAEVRPRAPVDLVLSDGPGPPPVPVPSVLGLTQAAATTVLFAANLAIGTVTTVSSTVTAGNVLFQNPAGGTLVNARSAVNLVVSTGPDNGPIAAPRVVGLALASARAFLTAAGLVVGTITTEFSTTVPAGAVISQSPAAGIVVNHGSTVNLIVSSGTDGLVIVPALAGLTQAQATAALASRELSPGLVLQQYSSSVPAGSVISHDPPAGTPVTRRSSVDLLISRGPGAVTVPYVVGMTQAAATAALTEAMLLVGVVTSEPSTTAPHGNVIRQSPPGGFQVNTRASVDLVVSSGPGPRVTPDVVGLPLATARAAITSADLVLGVLSTQSSMSVPVGSVISQVPSGGAIVSPGSKVDLVVSTGPPHVPVPNVVGLPRTEAASALSAAGLAVGNVILEASLTVPADAVISQNPAGGVYVIVGSAVGLVVSSGLPQVAAPNVVGLTQAAAGIAIASAGLVVGNVTTQASSTVPAGSVIGQTPVGGTQVVVGSAISLVVSSGPPQVAAPNVVGLTQAAAGTAIAGAGLVLGNVTGQASSTVPAGSVISQSPAGGTQVVVGSAIALVVSSGPQQVAAPNVVGLTQAAAGTAIAGAGLVVGNVTTQPSSTVPAGSVISQNPTGGTQVVVGSAIALVVSSGPPQVAAPNVVGLTQAAAGTAITGAGLILGNVTTQASSTVPAGSVISQSPAGGTQVVVGSAIALVVSSGPPQVTAPNVVGLTQAAATTAIAGVGLVVGNVATQASSTIPAGSIISQNPAGGTQVTAGSSVHLVVSSGPSPVVTPNVVGLTQTAATTVIGSVGLVVGNVTMQASSTAPTGSVIGQNPAGGTQVGVGSRVHLVVSSGPPQVAAPNVVGLTQAAAATALASAGLMAGNVTTQSSATVPAGHVMSQTPAGGTQVSAGSSVHLVVSSGPSQVVTPNVVGLSQAAATTALASAGLMAGNVTTQSSATVPAGHVISQTPAGGTQVNAGSSVHLVVSSGPSQVVTPNVVGLTQAAATTAVASAGLVVGNVTTQSSATVPAGAVISQNPAGGTQVAAGSSVRLVVASGPEQVVVPYVIGEQEAMATISIFTARLVVRSVTMQASLTAPAGTVIRQSPSGGSQVNVGSIVDLVASSGPPPVPVPNVVGLPQAAAITAITGLGFVVRNVTTEASMTPAGHVISQSPAWGTTAVAGFPVDLKVSTGPRPVVLPNVVGLSQDSAAAAILATGLIVGHATLQASGVVPVGVVISQNPVGGTTSAVGSAVYLVVSSGPQRVALPFVVGLPQAAAASAISATGLVLGSVTTQAGSSAPAGYVISQQPIGGTMVDPGSVVHLVVSGGPGNEGGPDRRSGGRRRSRPSGLPDSPRR